MVSIYRLDFDIFGDITFMISLTFFNERKYLFTELLSHRKNEERIINRIQKRYLLNRNSKRREFSTQNRPYRV